MYLRKLSMWSALSIAVLVACGQQEPTDSKGSIAAGSGGRRIDYGSGYTLPDRQCGRVGQKRTGGRRKGPRVLAVAD